MRSTTDSLFDTVSLPNADRIFVERWHSLNLAIENVELHKYFALTLASCANFGENYSIYWNIVRMLNASAYSWIFIKSHKSFGFSKLRAFERFQFQPFRMHERDSYEIHYFRSIYFRPN